ncbi:MAG: restriction endonuclease subunit S [Chlorobiota bacterium]
MKKGWKEEKLGDVCEYDKSKYYDEGLPYIGLEHIESNTGNYLGDFSLVNLKSSTFRFSKSHLLYGRLRPYLNKVLIPDFDGHCSTEIFPIKLNSEILREYLFYWFIMGSTVAKINATCTGARMPRANMNEIINFPIPIPPLAEQKKIVAILDRAFAAIDEAKANTEQNIVNAKEIFQSRLDEIFSNPKKGWKVEKLGDVCENLDRLRVPISKNKRLSGKIPYYGATGIVDYVSGYIFDEELLLISEDGANLLARKYPIAFTVTGKSWVNNHAHVLKFSNSNLQKFVEYYINSINLDSFISGMAQPKLNQSKLNSIPIPIPPLAEQKKIVAELDKLRAATDQMVENYEQKLEDLEELRKSILEQAFLGELT